MLARPLAWNKLHEDFRDRHIGSGQRIAFQRSENENNEIRLRSRSSGADAKVAERWRRLNEGKLRHS